MEKDSKLGTIVHGIGASEHLDTSGEIIDIKGLDISSLGGSDSVLNWEHNSKQNPVQVCGKITFAKKIFSESDCSNDNEKKFWAKCKKPFVYVKGELFDHPDLGHDGAKNVAAMLRYNNKDKGDNTRSLISFSVEGGKIEKQGMVIKKSIARDVALTIKHANHMCIAEILDDIKDRQDLYKEENFMTDLKKEEKVLSFKQKADTFKDAGTLKQKMRATNEMTSKVASPKADPGMTAPKEFRTAPNPNQGIQQKAAQPAQANKISYFAPVLEKKITNPVSNLKNKETFMSQKTPSKIGAGNSLGHIQKKSVSDKNLYSDPDFWKSESNLRKALAAGIMNNAPDAKTGMEALASENLDSNMQNVGMSKKKEQKAPKATEFVEVDPSVFHKQVSNFRSSSELAAANIHPYEENDYKQMKTFMSPDMKSGYAIKNGNELVSVHSSEKGRGDDIVSHAVKSGARKLDAYDIKGKLPSLYGKFGFKEKARHKFDPQYADSSNKTLNEHKPDFVEMHIPDPSELFKNQPSFSAPKMGVENKPEMQVKTIDPSKKYTTKEGKQYTQADIEGRKIAAKQRHGIRQKFEAEGKDPSKALDKVPKPEVQADKFKRGSGVSTKSNFHNDAYDYSAQKGKTMSRQQVQATKGRGNYPSTKHHEGLHRTLAEVSKVTSPKHSESLVNHILDNMFDKQQVEKVGAYVKGIYGDKAKKEETLTHVLDLLTNKKKRQNVDSFLAQNKMKPLDYNNLKQGWKNTVKFGEGLSVDSLNEIHNRYSPQETVDVATKKVAKPKKSLKSNL